MKHLALVSFFLAWINGQAQFDNALQFDGDEAHVLIPHHPAYNMTNAMTIEVRVWAADYDPGGWQEFVYKGGNAPFSSNSAYRQYYIRPQNNTGRAQFKIHDTNDNDYNSKSDFALTPGVCYHLAGVFDGYTTRMYVNGILEDVDSTGAVTLMQDTGALAIARQGSRSVEEFEGEIGEVRLWNIARTAEAICETIDGPLDPAYYASADSGLVGYWRLNEGSGTTAIDLSVNQNHGELRDGPDYIPACSSPSCILSIGGSNELDVSMGPNPADQFIRVNAEDPIRSAALIDLSGRTVWTAEYKNKALQVDLGHLPPGIYHLMLQSDQARTSKKIMILR